MYRLLQSSKIGNAMLQEAKSIFKETLAHTNMV